MVGQREPERGAEGHEQHEDRHARQNKELARVGHVAETTLRFHTVSEFAGRRALESGDVPVEDAAIEPWCLMEHARSTSWGHSAESNDERRGASVEGDGVVRLGG